MAMWEPESEDQLYMNWVTAGLAFNYTINGIVPFVNNIAKKELSAIISSLEQYYPAHCSQEHLDFRYKKKVDKPFQIPSCICSAFLREILQDHVGGTPNLNDVKSILRRRDYLEYLKCYAPRRAVYNMASLVDADWSFFTTVCLNNRRFHKYLDPSDIKKCRHIRNEIMHRVALKITKETLREYINCMETLLQSSSLRDDTHAKDAVEKLKQLKEKKFHIVPNESKILKETASKEISEISKRTRDGIQQRALKLLQRNIQGENYPGKMTVDSSESKTTAALTWDISHRVIEAAQDLTGQQTDPTILRSNVLMLLDKIEDAGSYNESTGESSNDERNSETNVLFRELLNRNLSQDEPEPSDSGISDGATFSEISITSSAANVLLDTVIDAVSESDEVLNEKVEDVHEEEVNEQQSDRDHDQRKGDSFDEFGESASNSLLDEIVEAASESDEIHKEKVEEVDEEEETVKQCDKDIDQRKGDSFDKSGENASNSLHDENVKAASESDEIHKEKVEEVDEEEESEHLSDIDLGQRKEDSFDESGENASNSRLHHPSDVKLIEIKGRVPIDDDKEEDKCRQDPEPTKTSFLYNALEDQTEDSLLTGEELNDLCSKEGRTSPGVIKKCDKICSFIKGKSEDIVHVWPAYTLNDETAITFVVFTETTLPKELLESNWTLEIKMLGHCNDESKNITYSKDNHPLNTETARKISSVIDVHSYSLMQKHSYLSAISACSVMYEINCNDEQKKIVTIPCIVLYVLVKHFIPLKEEKYPSKLDEFPVDVREGEFHFCGGSATDYHANVRMGCAITSTFESQKHGSLGGFIEHPEYGICGITCAHVFLNDERKSMLKRDKVLNEEKLNRCEIFQPSYDQEKEDELKIGKLVRLVYKEGSSEKAGVDLAMFKIEQRPPVAGNFPDINGQETVLTYDSGKILGKSGISSKKRQVQKFGYLTEHTHGSILFDNATVRGHDFYSKMKVGADVFTTTLCKQYQIKSTDKNIMFGKLGDSGALVFINEETGKEHDTRCIGMVVGIWKDNTCAVTPIADILEELNVNSLMSFSHERLKDLDQKTAKRFKEMEEGIAKQLNDMEKKNEENLRKMEERIINALENKTTDTK